MELVAPPDGEDENGAGEEADDRGAPHPQVPPWDTARSRQTRPAASPRAPVTSNRPLSRTGDSGTAHRISATPEAPSPAVTQNMTCQLAYWMIRAAAGRPRAAPMPTVELISATAPFRRSGGSSSRRMLIDRGTTETAAPCSARAVMSSAMSAVSAQTTEPAVIRTRDNSSTRRLPYMSPARPRTG